MPVQLMRRKVCKSQRLSVSSGSEEGSEVATSRRSVKKVAKRPLAAAEAVVHGDLNMAAASLLYDMAALQPTERSQFGYKRAAKAIVGLPVSVADFVAAGTLREIPFVGPASARIITEVVELGRSPSVEAAIEQSTRPSQLASGRQFRGAY